MWSVFFVILGLILNMSVGASACNNPKLLNVKYEVPIDDVNLKPFTVLPISQFKKEFIDNKLAMSFTLPLELTGRPIKIKAFGPEGQQRPLFLTSENGIIECNKIWTQCKVGKYKDLNINMDDVRSYLHKQNFKQEKLEALMQISARFSGDPVGILHFRITK